MNAKPGCIVLYAHYYDRENKYVPLGSDYTIRIDDLKTVRGCQKRAHKFENTGMKGRLAALTIDRNLPDEFYKPKKS